MKRPLCVAVLFLAFVLWLLQSAVSSPGSSDPVAQEMAETGEQQDVAAQEMAEAGEQQDVAAQDDTEEERSVCVGVPGSGSQMTCLGKLKSKEEKNGKLIYYVNHCARTDPEIINSILYANTAETEAEQRHSISNFTTTQKSFFEKNPIENLYESILSQSKSDAEENIICYMETKAEPENAGNSGEDVQLGSIVCISGTVLLFDEAENEGQFDAKKYYESAGYSFCAVRCKTVAKGHTYDWLGERLWQCKRKISDYFKAHMQAENAAVLSAMLLGEKNSMPAQMKSIYQKSGMAHILAISGVKTQNLAIPLTHRNRINSTFVPLHIAKIYILKLCLDEEIIPRCRFPCSRGYFRKCINWQKKQ